MARQHDEAIASGGTIKSLHDTLKEGMLLLFEDEDLNIDASIFIDHLTIKEEADKIDKEPQFNLKERDNSEISSENSSKKRFALEGAGAKKTPVTNTETDSVQVTGDNDEDNETLEGDDGNRLALTESATPKITAEMSDAERAEILSKKQVIAPVYTGQADATILANKDAFEQKKMDMVKTVIATLGDEFGLVGGQISF